MNHEICNFVMLIKGDIDYLRIAVCPDSTNASRSEPYNGVWRLTRDQFIVIANNIANGSLRFKGFTPQEIAEVCDGIGIGNRFFRLNSAVGSWIDKNEPETTIDFMIGE